MENKMQDEELSLLVTGMLKEPALLKEFLRDYEQKNKDLRIIKNVVVKLMTQLGILNKDGSSREHLSIKDLTMVMMKTLGSLSKMKEEMSYLSAILPLIEKYKDL